MFIDSGLESDYLTWGDLTSTRSQDSEHSTSPPSRSASKHGKPGFGTMNLNSANNTKQPRTLAPNLTRRSHKKSRAGCYTCKNRKIKCGEQKPKCTNCLSKGLDCLYPTVVEPHSSSRHRSKDGSSPTHSLSKRSLDTSVGSGSSSSSFSMLDMRFFHHFLTSAYPHLPLGNDHVWVNEIPSFAEAHPYLMHAILSLGASHLSRLTGVDYRKESLTHRGLAIAGLNQALSSSPSQDVGSDSASINESQQWGAPDAMLATCYSLTFQASYMGGSDGLADFITMVRGCALTTAKIKSDDVPTAFNLQPNWHFKVMAPRLAQLPSVDRGLLEDGIAALDEILGEVFGLSSGRESISAEGSGMDRPSERKRGSSVGPIEDWEAHEVEANFCQSLMEVLEALLVSPSTGYLQFSGLYAVWYELSPASFAQFLAPTNFPSQLLLSYFIALQMLMVPLAVYEWPERAESAKSRALTGTMEWAEGIFERLLREDMNAKSPSSGGGKWKWEKYLRWPRRIMGIVGREIRSDLTVDDERRLARLTSKGLGQGLGVKEEDSGVSVLKLGLPINPAATESGDVDISLDGNTQEDGSLGASVGMSVDVSEPSMFEYWEDGSGVFGSDVLVDPVLITTMSMDAGSTVAPVNMVEGLDLEMDMI